ncbi:MAG TPA: hypothetical protein VFJ14_13840 [Nocardioidaceae bacterium]|nr:hypothetical protein [Nocardioidaceae bacterium]
MSLIVVDAANVMGARPDGWWRDRAGAAGRLLAAMGADLTESAEVAVVLEGAARAAAEPGTFNGIEVVHAAGSGDDAIVGLVAAAAAGDPNRSLTVVTADRGLRARVEELGAQVHGPRWLIRRLEDW